MTVAEAQRRLQSIVEFKGRMQEFLEAKYELLQLKEHAERDYMMSQFDQNKVEARGKELLAHYHETRTHVARGLAEATRITDACGVPSQIPNSTAASDWRICQGTQHLPGCNRGGATFQI